MTKPLLLVGDLLGSAVEAMEMALELGYSPFLLVDTAPKGPTRCPAVETSRLTSAQKNWPAVIVGHRRYPDLEKRRLDRRWCEATQRLREETEAIGVTNWVSLVHPSALISPSAKLGVGVVIGPSANVSSDTTLGDFVTIGRSSSVSHDCTIGDYSRLGPGVIIPGQVTIGSKVVVGPSATFVNGLHISDGVFIGAGSVVTRHIKKPVQVMGNPARVLRRPLALLRRGLKRFIRNALRDTRYFSRVRRWYRTGQ